MNLRRKRLRLMRDTQWRGYARTAEGNPITLSQIRSVLSLSVLGNSTQDGTPSPDNPVDVVGVGIRTGNLFDAENIIENTEDATVKIEEYQGKKCLTWIDGGNTTKQRFMQGKFKENTQYTFRFSGYSKNNMQIFIIYTDGSYRGMTIKGGEEWNEIIFQSTSGKSIDYWCGWNNYSQKVAIDIESATIIEGAYTAETLPDYEPYGYKVAVQASGRNLFKQTGNTYSTSGLNIVAEHQEYIINGTSRTIFNLSLEKNINLNIAAGEPITLVTEILDGEIIYPENSQIFFSLFNSDNSQYIRNVRILKPQKGLIIATGNLPSTNSGYNIYIQCLKETGIVFNNVRIRLTVLKGAYTAETLPPYEPYKPPQSFNVYTPEVLHGVGSAHDSVVIDFDRHKAEFVKAIGFTQLKSSDNWSDNFYPVIYKSLSPTMKGNEYAMCNYMPYADTVNATVKSSNAQGAAIGVYRANTIDGVSDLGSFKAWLSDKDVYAYYPLATSTTTDITALQQWDALPNLKGTWILTAEGGTEPTLRAEYYSEERSTE